MTASKLSVSKKYYIGSKYKPYDNRKSSIFSLRPYSRDVKSENFTTSWERVDFYMSRRFITYNQVLTFSKRKWIAVSSYKARIYICEMCTEEIDEYLEL